MAIRDSRVSYGASVRCEDDDDDDERSNASHQYDHHTRKAFMRRVYATVLCQMLFIEAFICFFWSNPLPRKWLEQDKQLLKESRVTLMWITSSLTLIIATLMSWSGAMRRSSPFNYIFFAAFTLTLSFLLGAVSSLYETQVAMMLVGVMAAMCLSLSAYACQTKWDFAMWGECLICIIVALFSFGISSFKRLNMPLLYASMGSLPFTCFMVVECHLMLAGRHQYLIYPEEYIFAALNFYIDILNYIVLMPVYIWRFLMRRY